ncbi:hypothetical protein GCM10007320_24020 [Pseudorhodoferax aquiterrae]|uniref:Uncharacterized protein n=1 Tax=Pseudorhodoferax aquiterrae TaxID=747304 RepID=A0ABQ3G1B6_9BURK|nr:hypothetical protein [Pseudorhodoferax aquiterrae]GHC81616.1 hypothetical protein GCM10007320_24020 [Pseudorhodoferax aquiterrae]
MDHLAPSSTRTLAAGEQLHVHLPAGSMLIALHGLLQVQGPADWLAERMVAGRHDVPEGQAWTATQTGWHAVQACGAAAQFVCLASTSHPNGGDRWWRRVWRAWWRRPRAAAC